ncbi:methyltransferase domain-containing protein [Paenibacillus thalictri]|uniref:Methyltransferase domain-containing protein n=1 Tax=Paenibacillus thalictri TaxID=2527873 RepID=A0A4Q9DV49_9BACL|nr:methyltransferase domain-containing protein [Paenibacillus thalictri]TBL79830.1 methyltransferase domain-containing protein [Paenibacillus thalictri]
MNEQTSQERARLSGKLMQVLDSRSLRQSHKRLADMLVPGLSVLDIGCGTGAITRGIAEAVNPGGNVVGMDNDPHLIGKALQAYSDIPNLTFTVGDMYVIPYKEQFDIVTASRVLIWLSEPLKALNAVKSAAKKGGRIVISDYNHTKIKWDPAPPASMLLFYSAYLRWRADAGMDNAIADRLPELFEQAGIGGIKVTPQHEVIRRTDPDFHSRIRIWADTASSRGPQMERDGYITKAEYLAAEEEYREWSARDAQAVTMYMLAVEGVV